MQDFGRQEEEGPSDATVEKIQRGQGLGVPSGGSLTGLGKSRVSQGVKGTSSETQGDFRS